jgi:hypothetical protein
MDCQRGRLAPHWQSPPDFALFVRPCLIQGVEPPPHRLAPHFKRSARPFDFPEDVRSPFIRTSKAFKKLEVFLFNGSMAWQRGRLAPHWQSPPDFALFVRPCLIQGVEPPPHRLAPHFKRSTRPFDFPEDVRSPFIRTSKPFNECWRVFSFDSGS